MIINTRFNADSMDLVLFVGIKLLWISWVLKDNKFKCLYNNIQVMFRSCQTIWQNQVNPINKFYLSIKINAHEI